MILGFAHIAIGCQWSPGGFLTNYNVPSAREKWGLLKNRPLYHDLVIGLRGLIPIELVYHDTGLVRVPTRIRVREGSCVEIRARNDGLERAFFSNFGIRDGDVVRVTSPVKCWNIDVCVCRDPAAPLDPPLDAAGYAALAFYSTNVESDTRKLISAGGRNPTGVFIVFIKGRRMEISMLRSPEGTIVELVKICGE